MTADVHIGIVVHYCRGAIKTNDYYILPISYIYECCEDINGKTCLPNQ